MQRRGGKTEPEYNMWCQKCHLKLHKLKIYAMKIYISLKKQMVDEGKGKCGRAAQVSRISINRSDPVTILEMGVDCGLLKKKHFFPLFHEEVPF